MVSPHEDLELCIQCHHAEYVPLPSLFGHCWSWPHTLPFCACPNAFLQSWKFNLRYIAAPQGLTKLMSLKYKSCKLLLSLCLSLSSLCGVGISQHSSTGLCQINWLEFCFSLLLLLFLLLATGGRWLLSLHYLSLCLWGLLWFLLKSVGMLSLAFSSTCVEWLVTVDRYNFYWYCFKLPALMKQNCEVGRACWAHR